MFRIVQLHGNQAVNCLDRPFRIERQRAAGSLRLNSVQLAAGHLCEILSNFKQENFVIF